MEIKLELTKDELYALIQALMQYRRENERKIFMKKNHKYEAQQFQDSDSVLNKVFERERALNVNGKHP